MWRERLERPKRGKVQRNRAGTTGGQRIACAQPARVRQFTTAVLGILVFRHRGQEEPRRKASRERNRRDPETEVMQGAAVQPHFVIDNECPPVQHALVERIARSGQVDAAPADRREQNAGFLEQLADGRAVVSETVLDAQQGICFGGCNAGAILGDERIRRLEDATWERVGPAESRSLVTAHQQQLGSPAGSAHEHDRRRQPRYGNLTQRRHAPDCPFRRKPACVRAPRR